MKEHHRRAVLVGLLVLTLGLATGTMAASGVGTVTIYTNTGINDPIGIAAGPDGALWFTNHGNNSIGRITTAGAVTNFTDPSISLPYGITVGPDGAMWFTEFFGFSGHTHSIGRITTQ
jgi:virginiamycin B lyase